MKRTIKSIIAMSVMLTTYTAYAGCHSFATLIIDTESGVVPTAGGYLVEIGYQPTYEPAIWQLGVNFAYPQGVVGNVGHGPQQVISVGDGDFYSTAIINMNVYSADGSTLLGSLSFKNPAGSCEGGSIPPAPQYSLPEGFSLVSSQFVQQSGGPNTNYIVTVKYSP